MKRIKNIEAYIEHRIQRELDRSLNGAIERKLKALTLNSIITRHQVSTINHFTRSTLKAGINQLMNFGPSDSQVMGMFANEVRRAVLDGW